MNIVRFVGQGRGNNFTDRLQVRTMVNANGVTTTVVDNAQADCGSAPWWRRDDRRA